MNSSIYCPAVTAEKFSELSGLPLGVVNAQLDRRLLPVLIIGRRRLVNLESLRVLASSVPSVVSTRPRGWVETTDGNKTRPLVSMANLPSNA